MIIEKIRNQSFYYLRRVGAFGVENYQLMGKLKEIVENQNIMDSQTVIYGIPQVKETIDKAIYDVGFITHKKWNQKNYSKESYLPEIMPSLKPVTQKKLWQNFGKS